MKPFVIRASWISLAPARRMDVHYWQEVSRHLEAAGIDPADASHKHVKTAMEALAAEAEELTAKAKALRLKARAIDAEAKSVEDGIPQGKLA